MLMAYIKMEISHKDWIGYSAGILPADLRGHRKVAPNCRD